MSNIFTSFAHYMAEYEGVMVPVQVFDATSNQIFAKPVPLNSTGSLLGQDFGPGTYLVRATLPSGEVLADTVAVESGKDVKAVFKSKRRSLREGLSWAYYLQKPPPEVLAIRSCFTTSDSILWREKFYDLQKQEAIIADPAQKFALKKQIEEARDKIRELVTPEQPKITFWAHDSSGWKVINENDRSIFNHVQYEEGGSLEGALLINIGFKEIDLWREFPAQIWLQASTSAGSVFASLPTVAHLHVLIAANDDERSNLPFRVQSSSGSPAVDSLVSFLNSGDFESARAIGSPWAQRAEKMLFRKLDDPMAAVVGGYFLLQAGKVARLHDKWTANLAKWFEWLPDGAIIRACYLMTKPQPDVIATRKLLLEAVRRGLPYYTIGLRLLQNGLKLLLQRSAEDSEVAAALTRINPYLEASDTTSGIATFTGKAPDTPQAFRNDIAVPLPKEILTRDSGHELFHTVPGSKRAALPGSQIVGEVNPKDLLTITVHLRRASAPGEVQAHALQLGLSAPRDRKYLNHEEFVAKHGASTDDLAKITAFARGHGLIVVESSKAKRSVKLSGTIEALTAAFRVELHKFEKGPLRYRGRIGSVCVPQELSEIVVGVHGFDNRPVARPHYRRREDLTPAKGIKPMAAQNGSFSALQVAQLYNFPQGLDGTGQCIALIELNDLDTNTNEITGAGFDPADLQTYFSNLNLPTPQVIALSIDGGMNMPGPDPNSDGMVTLDIEVVGAIAPGAKIAVYFAPNTSQGFVDALAQAVHDTDNAPSVISVGWGGPEDFQPQQLLDGLNQALQDAATLGITVCCASGDNGSADMAANDPYNPWDDAPHCDFPASSPFVLACGGTRLTGSGRTITDERVWNEGIQGGAGGGGVSNIFARPYYQGSVNIPASLTGNNGRGLPDVSGNADPATGYQILLAGNQSVIGGTSAVAQLWAGLIARMNQQLVSKGSKPVGFLNPFIYGSAVINAGVFHDIVSGTNDITGTLNGVYSAGPGWDAASGLGVPDGAKLLQALGGYERNLAS
jgi:kumamolisin